MSTTETSRVVAVRQLIRVARDGAHVARLNAALDDPRDVRFVADLVAGVTRLRRRLDFLIAHFYHGELNALDDTVRQILRVGLYELLERQTPAHAAVSEAVATAKTMRGKGASGLVNAVLRATLRADEADALPVPSTGKAARDLAVEYSHPTWMVRRWLERFGEEETIALLRANNARPAYSLRVNTLKTSVAEFTQNLDELGVSWRPSEYLDDFVVVDQLQPVIRAGLLDEGFCAVQDEAAGLVVRVLDPKADESILDAAAAPGGKAIYAASLMSGTGRVVAVDVHASRARLIDEGAGAHGLTSIETRVADLRSLRPVEEFDRVLLDTPCSGLGVLSKRADLRWHASVSRMAELIGLQDELLDAAAMLVRPGGFLVYSTCTIEPQENEERVRAFVRRNSAYSIEEIPDTLPAFMRTEEGFLAALPHRHGTDGAFAARLRRSGSRL